MLPNDPVILLSYINTQLRDNYASFPLLCEDLQADAAVITEKLASIDYFYDETLNQFI